ncbi:hypothetical protein [Actinokineospora globicatena]|uniref:hypothetical protein n=1 Tax=Actinokineospora globicatena TaxID=103729 RepID=UPI0020A35079|nr:hypothetical protein [Actinokineospora globicatena]MCP2303835.1 hypothetical protein [Actinokineospora globicatena]GLW79010.1 hypothetical protein Aglo01_34920 [Actinokineospora globicatena]GLW86579.1 hypothetical protein Aglo02_42180 [Actinokineospora globicatena]
MRARAIIPAVVAVGSVLAGVGQLPAAGQTAGSPLACKQHSHKARDTYNNGGVKGSSAPVRAAGPYAGCAIDGTVSSGVRLHYHCYVINSEGNSWTWVRVVGQPVAGWIYSGNLKPKPNQKVGGSTERC